MRIKNTVSIFLSSMFAANIACAADIAASSPADSGQISAVAQLGTLAETEIPFSVPGPFRVGLYGREFYGLDLVKRFVGVPGYKVSFSNVVVIDPARFKIKTISAQKLLGRNFATIPEFAAAAPSALAIINAGFFDFPTPTSPNVFVGFYMENGKVMPGNGKMQRVFTVNKEGVPGVFLERPLDTSPIESAVSGFSGGNKNDSTARTAVCLTGDGLVKFVSLYPMKTLDEMTDYLKKEENCSDYVHLDGGGSTQMFYNFDNDYLKYGWERRPECYKGDIVFPESCYRQVANVLAVLPK